MSTAKPSSVRPRLTVALLTHNDAEHLGAALASVRNVADEILVIDDASTDHLAAIAAQHGARVIQQAWQDNASAGRNAGMAAASGDWVFWLDAGERLSVDQAQALRYLVDQQASADKAWFAYLQIPADHAHGAAQRIAQLRLLPNRRDIRFEGRVAETAHDSLAAMGIGVELSTITVLGDPREHDESFKRTRARRDLNLLDKEIPERGAQPVLLCRLGESHVALGNSVAAKQYFEQAVRIARPGSAELLSAYYGLLTTIDDAHFETRQAVCLQALDVYPFDAQLLCAMGSYLQSQDRLDLACRAYQTAVQVGQVNPQTWHLVNVGEVAAHCLATLWQLQEQADKAKQVLEEALVRFPQSLRLRRSLIDLEVTAGRVIDALGHAEKLPPDFPHREAFRSAIRGGCQAARNNWTAAVSYLETAYDAGCRDALCMRWLWISLVSVGRTSEAEPILREWQSLEPHNLEVRKCLASIVDSGADAELDKSALEARQMRVDLPQAALDVPASLMAKSGLPATSTRPSQSR